MVNITAHSILIKTFSVQLTNRSWGSSVKPQYIEGQLLEKPGKPCMLQIGDEVSAELRGQLLSFSNAQSGFSKWKRFYSTRDPLS